MEYESICVEPSITGLQVSTAGSSHVGRIFPTTPNFYSKLYWKIIVISHSLYNIRSTCWGEVQTVISLFFYAPSPRTCYSIVMFITPSIYLVLIFSECV